MVLKAILNSSDIGISYIFFVIVNTKFYLKQGSRELLSFE